MQLRITLGANIFQAEAVEELSPEFVSMYRAWLNAQNLEPAVTVEELTERLKAQNDALAAVVGAHTPQE